MKNKVTYGILQAADILVNTVVTIGVLLLFLYGCYAIWDTNTVVSMASPLQYEEYKPKPPKPLSFNELRAMNPEVFGWLNVYGTNVDYPMVQSSDNQKYLTTNAGGQYSLSGSIFLDYRNNNTFNDFNSIVYGHHMAYHSMFGDIAKFKDRNFFNSHQYGNIFFNGKDHGLEFFAFSEVDVYETNLYTPAVTGAESRQQYLDRLKDEALHLRAIDVTTKDQIILLSTCTEDLTNGRHVLIGRITDQVYENTYLEDEDKIVGIIEANKDILPVWMIQIMIVLVAAAIVVMKIRGIYKTKKDKNIGRRTSL